MSDYLPEELVLWLEDGALLTEVQDELITPAVGLSDDERAALWLFAWSYRPSVGAERKCLVGSVSG